MLCVLLWIQTTLPSSFCVNERGFSEPAGRSKPRAPFCTAAEWPLTPQAVQSNQIHFYTTHSLTGMCVKSEGGLISHINKQQKDTNSTNTKEKTYIINPWSSCTNKSLNVFCWKKEKSWKHTLACFFFQLHQCHWSRSYLGTALQVHREKTEEAFNFSTTWEGCYPVSNQIKRPITGMKEHDPLKQGKPLTRTFKSFGKNNGCLHHRQHDIDQDQTYYNKTWLFKTLRSLIQWVGCVAQTCEDMFLGDGNMTLVRHQSVRAGGRKH